MDNISKSQITGQNKKLIIATATVMILLFIADIFVPLGVALGVLYIVCLFILLPIRRKEIILGFTALSTFLTLLALLILFNDKTDWMVYANRLISLAAIWITAFLIIRYNNRLEIANNKLLERTKEIEQKNKELEQFVYIASHDLQEPLRTVISFSELLVNNYSNQFDAKGQKSIRFITEATGRMSKLIKALLDYSRIGKSREYSEVDCESLLDEIKSDLSTAISNANAKIQVGKLPVIEGYDTEMRVLFQNLLSNAIKFRRPDISPDISVDAHQENGYWKFAVSDNGIGIDEEYKDRIFKIFQRLHGRDEYKGTGIGLAHCKKIIELHGGDIWVDSNENNEGSTFYFTIPR